MIGMEDKAMTDAQGYHYQIIGRAIAAIDAAEKHVSLEDMAADAGLSAAHFQRTFTAWAGVSPKKFQQYLTLGHAKSLLKEKFTTLETAHAVGLSGTSRLHDLFIRWEAMSPGDFASGGARNVIRWGWFDTPFGNALAMGTERGLCGLAFNEEFGREVAMADMQSRWPEATYVEDPEALRANVEGAFTAGGESQILLIGRPLQIKVWEALMQIPSGHVTTYSEIAARVGAPKAVRAVGSAVGRNPVSFIIPCHRALRKSGGLGGYHWGLPVKRTILAWEAAQMEAREAAT
ncbi:MAG: bifunctional helix-turn-helix domain-containing protein/methylated-DNA--[protein]-cysteine S-methyltransferase [Rhodobacteraceae bacterium]|nr:bifunctional helix-turn-helix domain-containing protein/methylated-DNA--[protein]-cysteine S-methyltransferase [Paracoccaceae bacterium]